MRMSGFYRSGLELCQNTFLNIRGLYCCLIRLLKSLVFNLDNEFVYCIDIYTDEVDSSKLKE